MFSAHSLAVLCVLIKANSGKKKGLFSLRRPNSTSLLISSCSARSQGACGRAVKQIKHGGRKREERKKERKERDQQQQENAVPFFFFSQSPANSKWARSDIPSRRTTAVKVNPVALKVCSWASEGRWTLEEETGARSTPPLSHPFQLTNTSETETYSSSD